MCFKLIADVCQRFTCVPCKCKLNIDNPAECKPEFYATEVIILTVDTYVGIEMSK